MNDKMKFKITLKVGEGEEKEIYSGICTESALQKRFSREIMTQLAEYNTDLAYRQLRAYDGYGRIVAQETFHAGKSV